MRPTDGPQLALLVAGGLGASPERESALLRARELGERLGDAKLMEALLALVQFRVTQRDFGPAIELAERVLGMAQEARASAMLAGAHFLLGAARFGTGQLPSARQHLNMLSSSSVPVRLPGTAFFSRKSPPACLTVCLSFSAIR